MARSSTTAESNGQVKGRTLTLGEHLAEANAARPRTVVTNDPTAAPTLSDTTGTPKRRRSPGVTVDPAHVEPPKRARTVVPGLLTAANAVRDYLDALAAGDAPQVTRSPALDRKFVETADAKLRVETHPLRRIELLQRRRNALARIEAAEGNGALAVLRARFVEHAKLYGDARGIDYATWREVGVSRATLIEAGIIVGDIGKVGRPRTKRGTGRGLGRPANVADAQPNADGQYECKHAGCDHAPFDTVQGLSMHVTRTHEGRNWSRSGRSAPATDAKHLADAARKRDARAAARAARAN